MNQSTPEVHLPARGFWLLFASAALGFQIACGGESPKTNSEGKDRQGPPRIELTQAGVAAAGIKTELVALRPVDEILSLTRTLSYDENKVAHVAPGIGGRVTRILADFGQTVLSGQALAEIDSAELGQALAEWRKSRSLFSVRQRDYDRAKRLLEGKAISQGDFLSREGEFLIAKAEVESMDNRLHLLGLSHDDAVKLTEQEEVQSLFALRSPIPGRVIDHQINPGEVVEAGKELFTIGDLENLWLLARLYEKDLRQVRAGQEIEIFTDALPNEVFTGKIDYIGDQVDKDTRTVRARAVIRNAEGNLKPGMFVRARLVVATSEAVPVIPGSAIQEIDGASTVFVEVQPNVFEPRAIETGRSGKTLAEVKKGLNPGDRVVSEGSLILKAELLKSELGEGD